MALYYFTFRSTNPTYHDPRLHGYFHVIEAARLEQANEEMKKLYKTTQFRDLIWLSWYDQDEWVVSEGEFYAEGYDHLVDEWYKGITLAEIFDMKEV